MALMTQTVLDLFLIPRSGANGAAMAATAALFVGAVSVSVYRLRFPFAWRSLLRRLRDLGDLRNLAGGLVWGAAVAPP